MDLSIVQCLRCSARSLTAGATELRCGNCGHAYPVRSGVPIFLPEAEARPSRVTLSDTSASRLCGTAALPDDAPTRDALRAIFAWNYHLPDLSLDAENNYYFHRVGLADVLPRQAAPPAPAGNRQVHYAITSTHIPPTLPAGRTLSWNVRVANQGTAPLAASGPAAARIVCRWRDAAGELAAEAADPTELPIDLSAGRVLSVPAWIEAPATRGRYTLEVGLCCAGEWLPAGALASPVKVVACWNGFAPRHWKHIGKAQETYSYQEDHELGRDFLREELARRGLTNPRLLEVGGCSSPMLWDFPGTAYSVDIDVQTVQVGALRFGRTHSHLRFLAADANRLPFTAGTFDGAVLFATLHHLADPTRCLRELRRVVRPGGFVMLSSEPVGSYRAASLSAEFRRELEQGINEQIFTAEEYARMFRLAGLIADRAEIDRGSLRAVLRRRSAADWVGEHLWQAARQLKRAVRRSLRGVVRQAPVVAARD